MLHNLIEHLTVHNKIRDSYRISSNRLINNNKDIICGVIVISRNSKILLVQGRSTGKWSLPKGHLKKGETYEECAKRELFEETGIKINSFIYRNDIVQLRVGTYYFLETEKEYELLPCDSSEVKNAEWFSLKEIAENMLELNADANYIFRCLKKCILKDI